MPNQGQPNFYQPPPPPPPQQPPAQDPYNQYGHGYSYPKPNEVNHQQNHPNQQIQLKPAADFYGQSPNVATSIVHHIQNDQSIVHYAVNAPSGLPYTINQRWDNEQTWFPHTHTPDKSLPYYMHKHFSPRKRCMRSIVYAFAALELFLFYFSGYCSCAVLPLLLLLYECEKKKLTRLLKLNKHKCNAKNEDDGDQPQDTHTHTCRRVMTLQLMQAEGILLLSCVRLAAIDDDDDTCKYVIYLYWQYTYGVNLVITSTIALETQLSRLWLLFDRKPFIYIILYRFRKYARVTL